MNLLLERSSQPPALWVTCTATVVITTAFAVQRSQLGIAFIEGIAA